MKQRWRIAIELTWDILPEDEEVKWPGDEEVDFAGRAFDRVRPLLTGLLGKKGFAHFHILEANRRVIELD